MKGLTVSEALLFMGFLLQAQTLETGFDKGTIHCSREKSNDILQAEKSDNGSIVSGKYPGNYSTDGKTGLWCQIHIQVCGTCKLRLQFEELSFATCNRQKSANKDWCYPGCDHIHIFEVDDPYSRVTHRDYFKENQSDSYISISSNMKIRHCTGSTVPEDGKRFRITYKVEDKTELYKGVVSQYGESTGTVVSPNFPNGYALNGDTFTYMIQNLDPYGHVRLTFDDWDIAPETKIKVYDGFSENSPHTTLERYKRQVIVSQSNTLLLVLSSGKQYTDCCYHSGFKAQYQFVSDLPWKEKPDASCSETHAMQGGGLIAFNAASSSGETWTIDQQTRKSGRCDSAERCCEFNGQIGRQKEEILKEVSGPAFYDCVWLIKRYNSLNTADAVVLRLREFLLGDGWLQYGRRNTLEIRNGVTSEAPLLARYTARNVSDLKGPFTSQEGLYIRLRGGFYNTDKLSFMYTAVKNVTSVGGGCPGYFDFLCHNLLCIEQELMCDGVDHCGDGSDESPSVDCSVSGLWKHSFKWSMPYQAETTLSSKTTCIGIQCGRTCITMDQICDGVIDCEGREDEDNCGKSVKPTSSGTSSGTSWQHCQNLRLVAILLVLLHFWHFLESPSHR